MCDFCWSPQLSFKQSHFLVSVHNNLVWHWLSRYSCVWGWRKLQRWPASTVLLSQGFLEKLPCTYYGWSNCFYRLYNGNLSHISEEGEGHSLLYQFCNHRVNWLSKMTLLCMRQKGILNLPTSSLHLCSPLQPRFLGQDSPSAHLFSKTIGSRFTPAKIKLGEDSPSWFIYFR